MKGGISIYLHEQTSKQKHFWFYCLSAFAQNHSTGCAEVIPPCALAPKGISPWTCPTFGVPQHEGLVQTASSWLLLSSWQQLCSLDQKLLVFLEQKQFMYWFSPSLSFPLQCLSSASKTFLFLKMVSTSCPWHVLQYDSKLEGEIVDACIYCQSGVSVQPLPSHLISLNFVLWCRDIIFIASPNQKCTDLDTHTWPL